MADTAPPVVEMLNPYRHPDADPLAENDADLGKAVLATMERNMSAELISAADGPR